MGRGVKVALIHGAICWKNKEQNIANLLELNEKAASTGAQIILNTELATSGYEFENRSEIAPLTETIPGPTTEAFGQITKKYGCYICLGLPEVDAKTGIFYNAAAVIGPEGNVVGKYRKLSPAYKENLWSARGNLPVLVVETEFGKLGVVICADSYYYKPARIAALQGARLLLVPANWPPSHYNPQIYWRARAVENGMYIMGCNRTGKDKTMDCTTAESFIIDSNGEVVKKISSPDNDIIYHTIPLENGIFVSSVAEDILGKRQPWNYGNISLDTYNQFNPGLILNFPKPADFTVATLQYRPVSREPSVNVEKMSKLIDEAIDRAATKGNKLNLVVFPELSTTGVIFEPDEAMKWSEEIPGFTTEFFTQKAKGKNIYIILGMMEHFDGSFFNTCVLIGPNGIEGIYRKVHLSSYDKKWAQTGEKGFPFFDLPFGRIGMLTGNDLMYPECTESLAKMGTDLVCVPAFWGDTRSKFMWEARLAEQMHIALANQWGNFGGINATGESVIYSYSRYPEKRFKVESPVEGNEVNVMHFGTGDVREKRFLENIDYDILLSSSLKVNKY